MHLRVFWDQIAGIFTLDKAIRGDVMWEVNPESREERKTIDTF